MAASSRRSAAAREAEEGLAAAVRCTSALGDALLLAVGAAHTCAVLLQRKVALNQSETVEQFWTKYYAHEDAEDLP